MLKIVPALLVLAVGTAIAVGAEPDQQPASEEGKQMLKAVIHINFGDRERQGHGLKNVQNILNAVGDTAAIEVVCHGEGISLVVKGGGAHAEQVGELLKQRVRFVACENTMKTKSISREDLLPGVDTVPSGAVEIIRKQQEGYGYFKP
jgi:intracellular sulfur oxidation DsrE/DsrF family protein